MTTYPDLVNQQVGTILNNINYTKIAIVMNLLNWKWDKEVPNESQIRNSLRSLLYAAYDMALKTPEDRKNEWVFASGGGLIVWCCIETASGKPLFHASFMVDNASNLY